MDVRCPACGKTTEYNDNPFRPFCSKTCKMKDFLGWIDEDYRIAGAHAADENTERDESEYA